MRIENTQLHKDYRLPEDLLIGSAVGLTFSSA